MFIASCNLKHIQPQTPYFIQYSEVEHTHMIEIVFPFYLLSSLLEVGGFENGGPFWAQRGSEEP